MRVVEYGVGLGKGGQGWAGVGGVGGARAGSG